MEKGLLFLTLSMLCLWAVLDELFGDKRISGIARQLTPTSEPMVWLDEKKATDQNVKIKEKIDKDDKLSDKEKDHLKKLTDKFFNYKEI